MALNIKHKIERKAFGRILDSIINKGQDQDPKEVFMPLIDMMEKILGDAWQPSSFQMLRDLLDDPDSKWAHYIQRILRDVDPHILKTFVLNAGYESGFRGYKTSVAMSEKHQCNIPWIILMDPTTACNLHCTGCWAAEYGDKMNLSFEDMDKIVTEGKELGIHAYLFTGGEPLIKKKDIIRLCEKHSDCAFHAFTNGTLIDEEFCSDLLRVGNFFVSVSIEGFEESNDGRRGAGHYQKALDAMDLMHARRIPFGVSICYTSANYLTVTSDEFLDMLIEKGCVFAWYFHYMPVGAGAGTDLLLSPEQREYMYHKVREIRGLTGGKELFAIDFQNDGEFVHGCIAAGERYCHINANGDVEPCVFIHYSGANIKEKSLLECLKQPLFLAYRDGQPFNDNHLRPCPMLENPEILQEMVRKTGARSTDLEAPESAEHLCSKCTEYAEKWAVTADRLWKESEPERKQQ
ncbi:MAG: radical SAM protein [Emergencia sp.]